MEERVRKTNTRLQLRLRRGKTKRTTESKEEKV